LMMGFGVFHPRQTHCSRTTALAKYVPEFNSSGGHRPPLQLDPRK
jgi:hypothetical protein